MEDLQKIQHDIILEQYIHEKVKKNEEQRDEVNSSIIDISDNHENESDADRKGGNSRLLNINGKDGDGIRETTKSAFKNCDQSMDLDYGQCEKLKKRRGDLDWKTQTKNETMQDMVGNTEQSYCDIPSFNQEISNVHLLNRNVHSINSQSVCSYMIFSCIKCKHINYGAMKPLKLFVHPSKITKAFRLIVKHERIRVIVDRKAEAHSFQFEFLVGDHYNPDFTIFAKIPFNCEQINQLLGKKETFVLSNARLEKIKDNYIGQHRKQFIVGTKKIHWKQKISKMHQNNSVPRNYPEQPEQPQQMKEYNRHHIKRPLNAFMIWSQRERRKMIELNPDLNHAEISKILGKRWRHLTVDQRTGCIAEAASLKLQHKEEHPEYKFRPRKRKITKSGSVPLTTKNQYQMNINDSLVDIHQNTYQPVADLKLQHPNPDQHQMKLSQQYLNINQNPVHINQPNMNVNQSVSYKIQQPCIKKAYMNPNQLSEQHMNMNQPFKNTYHQMNSKQTDVPPTQVKINQTWEDINLPQGNKHQHSVNSIQEPMNMNQPEMNFTQQYVNPKYVNQSQQLYMNQYLMNTNQPGVDLGEQQMNMGQSLQNYSYKSNETTLQLNINKPGRNIYPKVKIDQYNVNTMQEQMNMNQPIRNLTQQYVNPKCDNQNLQQYMSQQQLNANQPELYLDDHHMNLNQPMKSAYQQRININQTSISPTQININQHTVNKCQEQMNMIQPVANKQQSHISKKEPTSKHQNLHIENNCCQYELNRNNVVNKTEQGINMTQLNTNIYQSQPHANIDQHWNNIHQPRLEARDPLTNMGQGELSNLNSSTMNVSPEEKELNQIMQEIKINQKDFGLRPNYCPWPNCETQIYICCNPNKCFHQKGLCSKSNSSFANKKKLLIHYKSHFEPELKNKVLTGVNSLRSVVQQNLPSVHEVQVGGEDIFITNVEEASHTEEIKSLSGDVLKNDINIVSVDALKGHSQKKPHSTILLKGMQGKFIENTKSQNQRKDKIELYNNTSKISHHLKFLYCATCCYDFYGYKTISEMVHHVQVNHAHLIRCKACKCLFNQSNQNDFKSVYATLVMHMVNKSHIYNMNNFPWKENDRRSPSIGGCHICDLQFPFDEQKHVKEDCHLENMKLLDTYLDYCKNRSMNPISHNNLEDVYYFLKELKLKNQNIQKGIKLVTRIHDPIADVDLSYEMERWYNTYIEELGQWNKPKNEASVIFTSKEIKTSSNNFIEVIEKVSETAFNNFKEIIEENGETASPYEKSKGFLNHNLKYITHCPEVNCGKTFADCTLLLYHLLYSHKIHPAEYINKHRPNSTIGEIQCNNCDAKFDNPVLFGVHHDKHIEKYLHCEHCKMKYTTPFRLHRDDFCADNDIPVVVKTAVNEIISKMVGQIYTYRQSSRPLSISTKIDVIELDTGSSQSKEFSPEEKYFESQPTKITRFSQPNSQPNNCYSYSSDPSSSILSDDLNKKEQSMEHSKLFECYGCDLTFETKPNLENHKKSHLIKYSQLQENILQKRKLPSTLQHTTKRNRHSSKSSEVPDKVEHLSPIELLPSFSNQLNRIDKITKTSPLSIKCSNNTDQTSESSGSGSPPSLDIPEYVYFCLDCEEERQYHTGEDCDHLQHPRVPLTLDVSGHCSQTGHLTLEPVKERFLNIKKDLLLNISNVSYSKKWGNWVRKEWKRHVNKGDISSNKYGDMRECQDYKCGFKCDNSVVMFRHIREHHLTLRECQNSECGYKCENSIDMFRHVTENHLMVR